jgi:hypothetical protein
VLVERVRHACRRARQLADLAAQAALPDARNALPISRMLFGLAPDAADRLR